MTQQLDLFELMNELDEEKETSLTPRQWALYRLIEHNSTIEHRKTTQKEIFDKLKDYGYKWNESENTSDHCTAIWDDVTKNNLSFEHEKLIITYKYEYWIGSKRETKIFLQKLWNDLSPRLKRYWDYVRKVGYDGQGRLYDKYLNPIDCENEKARMFRQSFNEYDVSMQKAMEETENEDNMENN